MAAFPPTPLRLPSAFPPRGAAPKRPLNVARGCGAPSGQSRCRHYVSGSGVSFRYAPGDPTALHFAAAIAPTPSRGGAAPCHLRQKAVAPTPLRLSPQGKGGLFVRYRLSPSALLAPGATLLPILHKSHLLSGGLTKPPYRPPMPQGAGGKSL